MDLTDLLRRSLPAPPLMTLLAALPLHAAPPLRFLVVDGHGMPLAQARAASGGQRGAALGPGIIKEWQDALAAELGRTPVSLVLPRKRQDQAVARRQVDLRCFVSPEWLSADAAADYDWPPPFMDVEERVVGNAGAAPVHTMADLDGKRIGTVHGYQYRKLAPLSDAGRARRDDAPSGAALLAKQLAGRTDVSVMRTLDFHYLQRRDPRLARLALAPLVISRFSLYCARTRYSSVTLDQLQLAQQRLLQAGIPDKILQSYR
ncbi:substrate-binding periplasmic protein [Pseudoduganella sp. UC29_71]|uniref:substrate-binding periplasmic protein n=1 Tax=Pseudoduganella sp. UC29_71 TaxID=3350174 RepID=UPI00366D58A4